MKEFDYIEKYIKPLTSYKGALELKDDVCFIDTFLHKKLVINCDSIIEGTHFFSDDTPESVANKALVSNISDLYAKGLKPLYYTLAISFNKKTFNENYIKRFTSQLQELQNFYNVSLIGGDTTVNSSKLCITINIFALTNKKLPTRLNAKNNENIYITRDLGDSYLGYLILANKAENFNFSKEDKKYFINKYHYLKLDSYNFIKNAFAYVSSSLDVSDGLLKDLNHICTQSNVGALLNQKNLPFSANFLRYIDSNNSEIFSYASQGGDYNLLFCANEKHDSKLQEIAKQSNTKLSLIGKTQSNKGLFVQKDNKIYKPKSFGYNHSF